jgi:EpsI family protein
MTARLGGRIEPVTYWFVIGERIALSGTQQKLVQLSYSTRGIVPDGLLMRVSTIDANNNKAYGVHAKFVSDLAAVVPQASRAQVFGQAVPTLANDGRS